MTIKSARREINIFDIIKSVALQSYFNPVGAHGSGFIGEAPNGRAALYYDGGFL